jgi:CubicO group peptidase (beta-lactamase class C family)
MAGLRPFRFAGVPPPRNSCPPRRPQSAYGLLPKRKGNRGTNYGWGIGICVLRTPHEGVAEMLSPGSYGHGGAWGTQAWIDPVKGVAYVLLV